MAKYCKTYNVICTCVTCENVECGYSPRTKAEAEIARGVKLDKHGNEVGGEQDDYQRIPSPVFAEAEKEEQAAEPVVRESKPREYALLAATGLLIVLLAATVIFMLRPVDKGSDATVLTKKDVAEEIPIEPEGMTDAEPLIPDTELRTAEPEPTATPEPTPEPTEKAAVSPPSTPSTIDSLRSERQQVERASLELADKGNEALAQKNIQEARKLYREAIDNKPDFYQGYNNLANTYSDEGNHDEAVPLYQQGLKYAPDSRYLLFNIANTSFRSGKYSESLLQMEHLISLDEGDSEARLIAGICAYKLGMWERARSHFEECVELDPSNAEAFYNLYLAASKMGQQSAARTYFNEAVRLRPEIRSSAYREKLRKEQSGG